MTAEKTGLKKFIKTTTIRHAKNIGPLAFVEKYLFPAMRREHGNGFGMNRWKDTWQEHRNVYSDGLDRPLPACNTVMCIGGTMQTILGTPNESIMSEILGLTNDPNSEYPAADGLFYGWQGHSKGRSKWPEDLREAFSKAKTPNEKRAVAEAAVLRTIETKGACLHE